MKTQSETNRLAPATIVGVARKTYFRIVVPWHGGPDVLDVVEAPIPEPDLGQVRVRVLAAGVGFPHLLMREGTYPGGPQLPFTPGIDVVGEGETLGPDVLALAVGDRVAGLGPLRRVRWWVR
jgi:NADPH2:quinone reductase